MRFGRMLSRLLAPAVIAVACGAAALGCAASSTGPKQLSYTEDARRAYEEAMQSFRSKDWESARPLFQEVKKRFPQSRYARLAELRLADCDFAQEKYTDAISAFRSYVTTYRADREVEYARYKLSKALYFDISDTILQPPAEERDQATTIDAHRELRAFNRAFPRSRYRKDVDYMLEVVTGRLARHELYVAHYYRKRDNFDATVARVDFTLKTYPNSGLDAEALVFKGETLMMMNRRKEAKLVFELVIKDWGGPFANDAKSFLEELKTPSQATPQIRRPADPGPPPPKPDPKKVDPKAPPKDPKTPAGLAPQGVAPPPALKVPAPPP